MNLTDEQIIKALRCCLAKENCEVISCEKCPLERIYECKETMFIETIYLINRQQAEIERLYIEGLQINKTFMDFVNKQIAEAIKEFAERLKRHCYFNPKDQRNAVAEVVIDYYVKEMVGEG